MSGILKLWERERARRAESPDRIPIFIHLRDTESGHDGVLEMPYDTRYLTSLDYMFRDGNYGCDCNRICFLAQVNPIWDEAVDIEPDCNYGPNRIAIDMIVDKDGHVLYRDD